MMELPLVRAGTKCIQLSRSSLRPAFQPRRVQHDREATVTDHARSAAPW